MTDPYIHMPLNERIRRIAREELEAATGRRHAKVLELIPFLPPHSIFEAPPQHQSKSSRRSGLRNG